MAKKTQAVPEADPESVSASIPEPTSVPEPASVVPPPPGRAKPEPTQALYGLPPLPPLPLPSTSLDPEAEARRRHRQHNTVRWFGAIVLALAVGAGSAFAVIQPKRTDLPGLATASDGRYAFPALTLPTLAPGQADPGNTTANPGGQHLADIRKLLLPVPQGAVLTKPQPGDSGWVPENTMVELTTPTMAETLATYGLRHTAGVSWKTSDGATTSIYLMQFADNEAAATAGPLYDSALSATANLPKTAKHTYTPSGSQVPVTYFTRTSGGTTTQYGYFTSGDTNVLIVFKAPKSVPLVPFEQELQLQSELLK